MHPEKEKIKACFNRAATSYEPAAQFQKKVADHLLAKLATEKNIFELQEAPVVLDLGAGTGFCAQVLEKIYPNAEVVGIDLAESMLQQFGGGVCADFDELPFANDSVWMICSSLAFQWSLNLEKTLLECVRVLKPGGRIAFSTLLKGSLRELHQAMSNAEHPKNQFITRSELETVLNASGLRGILITETLVFEFNSVQEVLKSLKQVGANHIICQKDIGLGGRSRLRMYESSYPKNQSERFQLSYEVAYFLGGK